MREHRLYEADWLMRNYGFSAGEITEGLKDSNLDLGKDPKLAWALRHRELFPVDINSAPKSLLLRIPGIGTGNVARILNIRRYHRLRLEDLRRLRVILSRARWFITAADHNTDVLKLDSLDLEERLKPKTVQPSLFDAPAPLVSAVTGQL